MGSNLIVYRGHGNNAKPWTLLEDYAVFDEYDCYCVCPRIFGRRHDVVSTIFDERRANDVQRHLEQRRYG